MDYTAVHLTLYPVDPYRDVYTALLAECGYDSFTQNDSGITAYIASQKFEASTVNRVIEEVPGVEVNLRVEEIPHTNWNAEWEKEYHPVVIDERCIIRALFHESMPSYTYEIIIQPQMSFGTGHHPTTLSMARMLLDMDVHGKTLLDLGTGTGVLAILGAKMGASKVVGTDIEDHIIENARANARHNDCVEIRVDKAELAKPAEESYQIILANINLNTLVSGLPMICAQAEQGAMIILSGFYQEDAPGLIEEAKLFGMNYTAQKTHQQWTVLQFVYAP